MKKIIFFIFFGVSFLGGYAQYWNLTGNSGTTNTDFIGTTDNTPLVFRTNGNEKMRLLSDKPFLGIGLVGADPQAPLHLWRVPPMDGTYSKSFQISSNPIMVFNPNEGFSIGCNNTRKILIKQNENANLNIEGPRGGLAIAPNGNIGFGTEQPQEKLHINDGNFLIFRSTPKIPNVPNGSLIFDVSNNINPLYNQWGIERVESQEEGYGLNFWKYYNDGGIPHKGYKVQSVLFLSDNQYVGIGTRTPQKTLDVGGSLGARSADIYGALNAQSATITKTLTAKTLNAETAILTGALSAESAILTGALNAQSATLTAALNAQSAKLTGALNAQSATLTGALNAQGATVTGTTYINGNLGIGISNPKIPLDVKGIIRAEEVKVCLSQGCDYVFEEDYELMNLSDLHTFIKTNKHLPDVAPAAEMEAEGIKLSEMNATLLKKVEELTLYIILIEKRLSELESEKGGE